MLEWKNVGSDKTYVFSVKDGVVLGKIIQVNGVYNTYYVDRDSKFILFNMYAYLEYAKESLNSLLTHSTK